jgi:hypothetical protein
MSKALERRIKRLERDMAAKKAAKATAPSPPTNGADVDSKKGCKNGNE